jgi:predicted Rossmann-fold nucleotide-binding protein
MSAARDPLGASKPRRVLVCGGRHFSDRGQVYGVLDRLHAEHAFQTLIHGAARGADSLAGAWAESRYVAAQAFPADWQRYGVSAGHIRNTQMLLDGQPDLVVAFPGGPGTANMIKQAMAARIRVVEVEPRDAP